MPGRAWFAYLRLYGPLEPYFDMTWRMDEIALLKMRKAMEHKCDMTMKITRRQILHFIAVALTCTLAVAAYADNKKEQEQKEIRKMAEDTLQRLYQADPKAKAAVEGAAGYAVFSNMGVKILVAGFGKGQGIAVNNKSKSETFMKMLELQAGLGSDGVGMYQLMTDKGLGLEITAKSTKYYKDDDLN